MSEAIVVTVGLAPLGLLEGAPCLRVKVDPRTEVGPKDLVNALMVKARRGTSTVWFDEAPWGEPTWDTAIATAKMSEQYRDVPFVACRDIADSQWSALDLHWLGDVTALLKEPITDADAMEVLVRLEYRPEFAELVAVNPSIENVRPSLLDLLYEQLNPANLGVVYTRPGNAGVLVRATTTATQCRTPWMVRTRE